MQLSIKQEGYEKTYNSRLKFPVCVHVMLYKRGQLVMVQRKSDVADDGLWGLPGGHVEPNESFYDTAIRELREELGIEVSQADLNLKFIGHASNPEYIGIFFQCNSWLGELKNMEPEKCHGVRAFKTSALPTDIIPYLRHILEPANQQQIYIPVGF